RDSWTGLLSVICQWRPELRSGPFAWARTIQDQAGYGVGGLGGHAGDGGAGDVDGDGDGGVAEALADHLGRDAGGKRRGGVAVADVVQPDRREAGGAGPRRRSRGETARGG